MVPAVNQVEAEAAAGLFGAVRILDHDERIGAAGREAADRLIYQTAGFQDGFIHVHLAGPVAAEGHHAVSAVLEIQLQAHEFPDDDRTLDLGNVSVTAAEKLCGAGDDIAVRIDRIPQKKRQVRVGLFLQGQRQGLCSTV